MHAINEKRRKIYSGEVSPTRMGLRKFLEEVGRANKFIIFEAGNQMKWISLYLKKMRDVEVHVVHRRYAPEFKQDALELAERIGV